MTIKCKICGEFFPDTKVGSAGQRAKICGKPECAKIRSRKYYLKWKASHPDQFKRHQHAQYERRKKKKKPEYIAIDTPRPAIKRWCQRCGRKTINYFHCPSCLNILTEGISQEYENFIYTDIKDISLTGRG